MPALLLAIALLITANGLVSTLVALRLGELDVGPTATGVVLTAYFVGLAAGCVWGEALVRRLGHVRAFAAFAAAMGGAFLSFGLFPGVAPWLTLRFVVGFCVAGLYVVVESWLNARAANATRGRVLGLYQGIVYGAFALGQMLLSLEDPSGMHRLGLAALLVMVSVLPIVLVRQEAPRLEATGTLPLRHVWTRAALGMTVTALGGVVTSVLYATGPVYAQGQGFDTAGVGRFMSALLLGGLAAQWPMGRLSDVFDRERVLALAGGTVVVASAWALLAPGQVAVGTVPFAIGWGAFSLYPIGLAHGMDRMQPSEMLPAASALLLCFALGSIAGPLIATAAEATMPTAGFFLVLAAGGGAVAALTWRSRRRTA